MKRLKPCTVLVGSLVAVRCAISPIRNRSSPASSTSDTTDGVVRFPRLFGMIAGSPFAPTVATDELVVPRSIPMMRDAFDWLT